MQIRLKQLDGVIDAASALQVVQWDAAAGVWKAGRKNNTAAADPTVNDDNTAGYELGSMWINTTTDNAFICVDATTAAAVWIGVGVSGEPQQEEYAGDNIPSGTGDTVLTAAPANTPVSAACVNLYLNGVLQRQGAGKDYTVTTTVTPFDTITWLEGTGTGIPMDVNDIITLKYESLST